MDPQHSKAAAAPGVCLGGSSCIGVALANAGKQLPLPLGVYVLRPVDASWVQHGWSCWLETADMGTYGKTCW